MPARSRVRGPAVDHSVLEALLLHLGLLALLLGNELREVDLVRRTRCGGRNRLVVRALTLTLQISALLRLPRLSLWRHYVDLR